MAISKVARTTQRQHHAASDFLGTSIARVALLKNRCKISGCHRIFTQNAPTIRPGLRYDTSVRCAGLALGPRPLPPAPVFFGRPDNQERFYKMSVVTGRGEVRVWETKPDEVDL